MSLSTADSASGPAAPAAATTPLHRAIRRMHVFAGLAALPFVLFLAITGGLYLYKDAINNRYFGHYLNVEVRHRPLKPASELMAAALETAPGRPFHYRPPRSANHTAMVGIETPAGERIAVFVDPYTASPVGQLGFAGADLTPPIAVLRRLHRLEFLGPLARPLGAAAAGFALLLGLGGLYLWVPRRWTGAEGVFAVRGAYDVHVFWRDLHAVGGALLSILLLFQAASGLLMAAGAPDTPAVRAALPALANERAGQSVAIDSVVATLTNVGIHAGYGIDLPGERGRTYAAHVSPEHVALARTVLIDARSGKVLFDGRFRDFDDGDKALAWMASAHRGGEFGTANRTLLTLLGGGLVIVSVAGLVAWLKRPASDG